MTNLKYTKHEKISLKGHPTFNEVWLQDRIAEDPSILGLGDLILKDRERLQPKAGRLDLLLQDQDSSRRYEVEVQLGSTDESHIIRTIEYWDVERKRYPQYDHTAVIVAEDITSRFLNVIGLFNGFIPLVAIQINAIKIGDQISLISTTVLDQMTLGLVEEDEEKEVADRSYWENRGTKSTVIMADKILELIQSFAPSFSFKYLKFYIGGVEEGQTNNFVKLRPQKNALKIELKMNHSGETEKQISEKGLDLIDYTKWGRYRIRISKSDLNKNVEFITDLLKMAYAENTG
jgi:predicted transport protein